MAWIQANRLTKEPNGFLQFSMLPKHIPQIAVRVRIAGIDANQIAVVLSGFGGTSVPPPG